MLINLQMNVSVREKARDRGNRWKRQNPMLKFVPSEQTKTSPLFGIVTHMLWEAMSTWMHVLFWSQRIKLPVRCSFLFYSSSFCLWATHFQWKPKNCSVFYFKQRIHTGVMLIRTHKYRWDVDNASLAFLLGLASRGRLPSVVKVFLLWNCHPQKVGLKNIPTLLSSFWLQSLYATEAKVSELNIHAKDTQHRWIIYAYK